MKWKYPGAIAAAVLMAVPLNGQTPARRTITVDYPADSSVFPPEFPAPTFLWRDAATTADRWTIEISFANGAAPIRIQSKGERMRIGQIDQRAVGPTNQLPKLTAEQAAAHTWKPDDSTWSAIKRNSVTAQATVLITGHEGTVPGRALSRGTTRLWTSRDPVGAPIFYRDVPLMPSETEKGIIKPLAANAVPLITWRLRDVGQTSSRVMMEGIYTCANCHSFSRDGKTLGLDVDGPQNDKGLYALVPVSPRMSIQNENVVAWSTFRGKLGGKLRVGFMSQVSPDGRFVVTTINDPGYDESEYQRRKSMKEVVTNYYVANFKDYRFLQVFYPTRGIIAWYSRESGRLEPLPGADDPRYVHTNAVWSPDGKYLVFARAEAKDPYIPGGKMAEYANDPHETQIRYDLYRVPFNDGKGGLAEPISGASQNGMSNSFPKVSPDGRWIVYVEARNGQLMRPDSRLYMIPAAGGTPRRMNCNTPLMNSWHSFSPNGRWLVFSSKSRSPYTQMFLTHISEDGNDTPPIFIENSTAANRAVNIPEFVNIASNAMERIDAPVTEYYRVVDEASELLKKRDFESAAAEWRKAVELSPGEAMAHNNLGYALSETGRLDEAFEHYAKALELSPDYPEAHNNLGEALVRRKRLAEAMEHFARAAELKPGYASAYSNMGVALAQQNRIAEAIEQFEKALAANPDVADVHNNLAVALAMTGRWDAAIPHLEQAVKLTGGNDPMMLDLLARSYSEAHRPSDAIETAKRAVESAIKLGNARLADTLRMRLAEYQKKLGN